ncbi:hypothetical protein LIER_01153 [Lithospermum erythrorhizon]|uniref:Uncharacterized protein n=1 Tax=Lithospermum erythrorhizon TaxID=34254 RepID=A0AAV3NL42_LITER
MECYVFFTAFVVIPLSSLTVSFFYFHQDIMGGYYEGGNRIIRPFAPKPNKIDFGEMLSQWSSILKRVAITSKTRPRKSLIPESESAAPIPSNIIPAHTVTSMLKRLASDVFGPAPHPSKRVKRALPKAKPSKF